MFNRCDGPVFLWLVLTLAVTARGAVLVDESFDEYDLDSVPPGWDQYYTGAGDFFTVPGLSPEEAEAQGLTTWIDETVRFGDSGKAWHFLDNTTSLVAHHLQYFAPATSVVLDYYMLTRNRTTEGATVKLIGDTRWEDSLVFANGTHGSVADFININGYKGDWDGAVLGYEENKWYHVRQTIDYAVGTGSLYVAEVDASWEDTTDSASFSYALSPLNSYIHGIMIHTSMSQKSDSYIDELNISGSVVPEPSTLIIWSLLGALGTGVGWWRRRKA